MVPSLMFPYLRWTLTWPLFNSFNGKTLANEIETDPDLSTR